MNIMNMCKMVYDGVSPADRSAVSTGNYTESPALNNFFALHLLAPKYITLLQVNQPSVFTLWLGTRFIQYIGKSIYKEIHDSCEIIIRSSLVGGGLNVVQNNMTNEQK